MPYGEGSRPDFTFHWYLKSCEIWAMNQKTVMITGASSGIGAACARRFATAGCRLVITGRNAEALYALQQELQTIDKIEVYVLVFDVRDSQAVEAAVASLPEAFEAIDILINNAGLALGLEPLIDGSDADWNTMIDTNVKGLVYVSRAVGRGMRARGRGHIIHNGSVAGKQSYANGAVYCGSKAAVDFITDAFRNEVIEQGIKVSAIHPGMVVTNFSKVRFHGDTERADAVYAGVRPLSAADVAESIFYMASAPAHVNIADMVLLSADQTPEGKVVRR
jgi:3-hydroxy acid dehydrogenase / malonic semialdehyde reductase